MADERTYYVVCQDRCLFEAMTKEQIIAAIAEATGKTPTDIDDAFITKLKEQNHGTEIKFWIGTTAEYNAIEQPDPDTFYIFTDDNLAEQLFAEVESAKQSIKEFSEDIQEFSGNLQAYKTDFDNLKKTYGEDTGKLFKAVNESVPKSVLAYEYGQITLPTKGDSNLQGNTLLFYPEGFTKDNSVIISIMSRKSGEGQGYHTSQGQATVLAGTTGNINTFASLQDDGIKVYSSKYNAQQDSYVVEVIVVLLNTSIFSRVG